MSVKCGRRIIERCSEAPPRGRVGRANARRENLIQAARQAIAAHGFHATGMAQIAQVSGIAIGQIYRDFANKEAIVAAIVERDLEEFLAESGLCAAGASGDPEAVRQWIRDFVACEAPPDGGRLIAEIMAEASRNERVAEITRNLHQRLRRELTAALQLLVPSSVDAARLDCMAEMIQTISSGVFYRRITNPDEPRLEVIDTLMGCIIAAIDQLRREA